MRWASSAPSPRRTPSAPARAAGGPRRTGCATAGTRASPPRRCWGGPTPGTSRSTSSSCSSTSAGRPPTPGVASRSSSTRCRTSARTTSRRCAQRPTRSARPACRCVVVGAGLPHLPAVLSASKSYSERLFRYSRIDRLDRDAADAALVRPARGEGAAWDPHALDAMYVATGGYPYFIQAYGKAVWDLAPGSPITAADVAVAAPEAESELAVGFFGSRFERATPGEREYLRAMAELAADAEARGPRRSRPRTSPATWGASRSRCRPHATRCSRRDSSTRGSGARSRSPSRTSAGTCATTSDRGASGARTHILLPGSDQRAVGQTAGRAASSPRAEPADRRLPRVRRLAHAHAPGGCGAHISIIYRVLDALHGHGYLLSIDAQRARVPRQHRPVRPRRHVPAAAVRHAAVVARPRGVVRADGGLIEFAQRSIPGRVPDGRDLLANGLGAVVGVLIAVVLTLPGELRRRRRRERQITSARAERVPVG